MLTSQQRFTSRTAIRTIASAALAVAFILATALFVSLPFAARSAATHAASAAPETITVARARVLPAGTLATIEGLVTVPSGAFKSGTSDEGFALQDRTGGLYVRTEANLGLRVGRRVRVTGRLADSNGQLILVAAEANDVRALGHGVRAQGGFVPTGRIGEATEGHLVRVRGTITKPVGNDLPYGYRVFINDGSGEIQAFVYASTGIDVSGLGPGQRIGVRGFSGQYKDHYEVLPRFQSDLWSIR